MPRTDRESIKTEAENEQALLPINQLMSLSNCTPKQEAIYESSIVLVEEFERESYRSERGSNPGSMLSFLMDQRDLKRLNRSSIAVVNLHLKI